jgi:hypothetical protein
MDSSSIRTYLQPYKIYGRRSTTVSHAFTSAIADRDAYDRAAVDEALRILEQTPDNLTCVYCGKPADGWDHLVSLVKDGKPFGPGHRIRNLVPSCGPCNAAKGNREVSQWLPRQAVDWEQRLGRLQAYVANADEEAPAEAAAEQETALAEYWSIRDRVLDLFRQADDIADRIHELRGRRDGSVTGDRSTEISSTSHYDPDPHIRVKYPTIGALCEALIARGWTTDAILAEVRRQFPHAKTTKGCVAWYRSKMKRR